MKIGISILLILIGIGLPLFKYKRELDLREFLISLLLLGGIVLFGTVGVVMTRFLTPYLILHIVATAIGYTGYIFYLFKNRLYWYIYLLPLFTLMFYFLLAFIGNRHISF